MPIRFDNVECGMLAMAIDTDGSIFMCKHKHGIFQKPSIDTRVTFTNQSMRLLSFVKNLIGGRIRPHSKSSGTFLLTIDSKDEIMNLLQQIYPYLIRKQKQAFLMMNFLIDRKSGKPYSSKDWKTVEKMKKLNRIVD